jgi:hypothetical protein
MQSSMLLILCEYQAGVLGAYGMGDTCVSNLGLGHCRRQLYSKSSVPCFLQFQKLSRQVWGCLAGLSSCGGCWVAGDVHTN